MDLWSNISLVKVVLPQAAIAVAVLLVVSHYRKAQGQRIDLLQLFELLLAVFLVTYFFSIFLPTIYRFGEVYALQATRFAYLFAAVFSAILFGTKGNWLMRVGGVCVSFVGLYLLLLSVVYLVR